MKIIFLTVLSLTLSSCFSTAINEGKVKKVSKNTYKTTYENYWRAPWSKEDTTVTARNISIKKCKDKGLEFAMKSHYYENPNINITYTCIDYNDKSTATEQLRQKSKLAIVKIEEFSAERKKRRAENSAKVKKGAAAFLNALASGYNQANQNMLNSIHKQNVESQNTGMGGNPQMAPDGSFVGGNGPVTMCPDRTFVSGSCHMAPDGSFVGM
jgi:hypothetical protein